MSFIEVKSGAPQAPQDWQDGTYRLVLTGIADPKTVTAQKGQMAGQDVDLIDWTFIIDSGQPFAGLEIRRSTSTASGPKSAMFPILTALLGGRPPAVGQKFEKSDLIGRKVYGALAIEDSGYIRVNTITALPASELQQNFAAVTGAPTQGTPPDRLNMQPAPVAVGAKADDLPF